MQDHMLLTKVASLILAHFRMIHVIELQLKPC